MEPIILPLTFVEDITTKFLETKIVGSGGYGHVYKGMDKNGKEVAVKILHQTAGLVGDNEFKNEVINLTRVQHRNIVRLIGYCDEVKYMYHNIDGETIFGKRIYRVLCFEYLQHGSLDKHLYEISKGFDWHTRYRIIKGICEGLNYLHEGLKEPILHLDLKPANILLDENSVPKIADFGLSRLFNESHSYATEVCKGTFTYMPPEFIKNKIISNKYDIFSLGVIIILIMAGANGFKKYGDKPEEFAELVYNSWKERIGATSNYTEQDCQQVKTCIEIALKCVESERSNRPTTGDIIRELKKTETNGTASSRDHGIVSKIGLWGGVGGGLFDVEVAPHLLESLIIGSGEVIYSFQYSYSDSKGQKHIAGPWGGYGPQKASYHHEIRLGHSEYITEVLGTIGPFAEAQAGAVTSLTVITNVGRRYGPFGTVRGTAFQVPVQSNGGIVGFFTYAGYYIDAFGIYLNPKLKTIQDEKEDEASLSKIGPWGGNGGRPCDIKVTPKSMQSVTIRNTDIIHSLEFSYLDHDEQKHTAGPWGSPHGRADTIEFGSSEFLTGVFGTTGQFVGSPTDIVTSLTFVTNKRYYGPFGQGGGTTFQISLRNNSSVVSFFGRADSYLDALGIYANSEETPIEQKAGLTKLGPWGGTEGPAYGISTEGPQPHRLERVKVRYDDVIHSIEFLYSDHGGRLHSVGPWGGPDGTNVGEFHLQPSEILQGISVTFGSAGTCHNAITSLAFATNQGRACGPYGQGGGTPFNILLGREKKDACIVGFFAHATKSYLEALGVYVYMY